MRRRRLAATSPGLPDHSVFGIVQDEIAVDLHHQAERARSLGRGEVGCFRGAGFSAATRQPTLLGLTLLEADPEDQSGRLAPFWSHHLELYVKSNRGVGK